MTSPGPNVVNQVITAATFYDRYGITVHHGDNLDVMREMADASVHAIVTDPPAGIRFMNRAWDSDMGGRHSWVEWLAERMREAHRVLKPGGYGLVWAMPRTSHWTAWALEDAGFEIRDCVVHLFGAGFPKSLDVSKAIDKAAGAEREVVGSRLGRPGVSASGANLGRGFSRAHEGREDRPNPALDVTAPATEAAREWSGWGTALKPAAEHWWLIRKPMPGTVAQNVQEHGAGALNIGACRVSGRKDVPASPRRAAQGATFGDLSNDSGTGGGWDPNTGRWPSNVVLTHGGCDHGCDESCPVGELDAQSGTLTSGANPTRRGSAKFGEAYGEFEGQTECVAHRGQDSGGASRFFPVFRWEAKAPTAERPKVDGKAHPTVKPLDLMRWMVRLVTPPGGIVLDLFAGTGTTGHAARAEGMRAILIEQDADHIPLIVSRLDGYRAPAPRDEETGQDEPMDLLDLLGGEAS